MQLEWFGFLLLLTWASALVLKRAAGVRKWTLFFVVALFFLTIAAAGKWGARLARRGLELAKLAQILPREGRPDGYVSSKKCQACQPAQYARWHRTFHRTMTQFASPASVKANFEDQNLELESETFHLYRRGSDYFVDMVDPFWRENERLASRDAPGSATQLRHLANGPRAQMRVGLLTGSHQMQVYWLSSLRGNMQMVFPFAWLIEDHRWAPFHQTFLRDPAVPRGTAIWNYTCIRCHATGGQPRDVVQGEGYDSRVGELGIACEACHGPAETHVALNGSPLRRYQLYQEGKGDSSIVNPARLASKRASEVCGQCHGIKWMPDKEELTQTGFRFRPGQELNQTTPVIQPSKIETQPWLKEWLPANARFLPDRYWPDGEVRVSGREFNGLIDSPCYQRGELSCLSCHSLHQSDPNDQLAAGMDSNKACLQCHEKLATKIQEHTHHGVDSPGSECYNCHMPYTTYGLLKNIRSHRITSPDVRSTLQSGRPNACNLCHLDRTLQWTANYLESWYQRPKPDLDEEQKTNSLAALLALKGDAGQRALVAWHMGWEPAQKISGKDWIAPFLAELLQDPYAAVRYIAGRSLHTLPEFRTVEFDFTAPLDSARRAHDSVSRTWAEGPGLRFDHPRPELFIRAPGQLDLATFDRLLQNRDQQSMDLQE